MTPDKREPRPAGDGRDSLKVIALGSCDRPEDRPLAPIHQARRRANFARDLVYAKFGYRDGRALDYDGFTDRLPGQPPVTRSTSAWRRVAP